jgi:hypothetical protein
VTLDARGAVDAYHAELVARLQALLGGELLGVYAGGSYALGDFDPGRSDLDVAAVCRSPLDRALKERIVATLAHEALPVPGRGLELVLYAEATVRVATAAAALELNLNTGRGVPPRVDLSPVSVERHWFPLDRAILREHGIALLGPPAAEVFAALPRELLLPVVREALEWQLRAPAAGEADAVLTACRALRYVREGRWTSKGEAGRWALGHVADAALVAAAVAARGLATPLGRRRVERLVGEVLARVDAG